MGRRRCNVLTLNTWERVGNANWQPNPHLPNQNLWGWGSAARMLSSSAEKFRTTEVRQSAARTADAGVPSPIPLTGQGKHPRAAISDCC